MKVYVCLLKQDDPKKCTARKLAQKGLVNAIYSLRRMPSSTLVLDPFASVLISPLDSKIRSIGAIDCSWTRVISTFKRGIKGEHRRLPLLLAGNPTNYGKLGKLSTAEALAATLEILGYKIFAQKIMGLFKWGATFLDLNAEPLAEYASATGEVEIKKIEQEFFPNVVKDYYKPT
ncbi:MAG: DUF367 family protein [Nitrososphaerales archaeon]|nr:DUF367 family protein [Nitrososphaerota archaeon]